MGSLGQYAYCLVRRHPHYLFRIVNARSAAEALERATATDMVYAYPYGAAMSETKRWRPAPKRVIHTVMERHPIARRKNGVTTHDLGTIDQEDSV